MKQCTKCKITQPLSGFHKRRGVPNGYQSWCKTCSSEHRKTKLQDPQYREQRNAEIREYHRTNLNSILRNKMRLIVRRTLAGSEKTATSQKLLGYSVKELRCHIENQFAQGMSWETHGAWHIDHIKPVSAFIAEGITDPKIINALSNLRPLWARDNLVKGAK